MTGAENFRLSVGELEAVYGTADSSGFGSAVFFDETSENHSTEESALRHYRAFIGAKWTAETEAAWLSGWKKVYVRTTGEGRGILNELGQLENPEAQRSVPLLTEVVTNAEEGRKALRATFDDPSAESLSVHLVGDGAALSGIMITAVFAGRKTCSLICLLD